jgi:hypothetical protein
VDPAGAGDRLIVAAEAGQRARALVHFAALPDSGAVLTSVVVRLTVLAAAPSSPLPRIEAFELVQPFYESLTGNQPFPGYVAESIGEGVSTEAQGDTAATYVFSGPAFVTVFQRWVNREHVNGGLLFAPAPGESGRVEFYPREASLLSGDPEPLLTLVRDDGGVPDTTRVAPDRDTFVAERTGPSLAGEPERLTIAGGVPVRSLLRFDVIPTLEQSLIHRAVLTLSVDSAASRFDSLVVVGEQVVDYPWEGEDTRANREIAARATAYAGVDTVALDLTTLARQWTLAAGENRGVRLRLSAEVTRLDWIRFFSSAAADTTRRPRLHVTYSPVPEVGG